MTIPIEERPFTSQCIDAAKLLEISPGLCEGIRTTPFCTFRSLGAASLAGCEVFVGFKTRLDGHHPAHRWAREAILADTVMSRFPDTIHAFPLFTLPVIAESDDGRKRGLLTEDFTQGGKVALEEYRRNYSFYVRGSEIQSLLEKKVFDAADGSVYREAFQHMAGSAGGEEIMVDYSDVLFPTEEEITAYEEIGRTLTLQIPE